MGGEIEAGTMLLGLTLEIKFSLLPAMLESGLDYMFSTYHRKLCLSNLPVWGIR